MARTQEQTVEGGSISRGTVEFIFSKNTGKILFNSSYKSGLFLVGQNHTSLSVDPILRETKSSIFNV